MKEIEPLTNLGGKPILDESEAGGSMKEIESLTSQEYSVLSLYLGLNSKGLNLTKSEIARLYGLSVARINTVISKGYQKLCTDAFKQLLKGDLDEE